MIDRSSPAEASDLSLRLKDWKSADAALMEDVASVIYHELKKIAARHLRRERPDHTLQPTELAHEAFIRLIDVSDVDWQGRAHFFAVAAQMVRRILVDHARARLSQKRGGGMEKVDLTEVAAVSCGPDEDLLALDEALRELQTFDERQSRIIELRFFGGLTVEETAAVEDISPATVKREWVLARAWLSRRLSGPV